MELPTQRVARERIVFARKKAAYNIWRSVKNPPQTGVVDNFTLFFQVFPFEASVWAVAHLNSCLILRMANPLRGHISPNSKTYSKNTGKVLASKRRVQKVIEKYSRSCRLTSFEVLQLV